jgi:hypothetical protein
MLNYKYVYFRRRISVVLIAATSKLLNGDVILRTGLSLPLTSYSDNVPLKVLV